MIKLIYFDIGGVIVTDGFWRAAPLFAKKLKLDEQKLIKAYKKTKQPEYSMGTLDGTTRWTNFFKQLNITIDNVEEYIELWHSAYQLIPETIILILKLKKKYRIGCLSDQPLDLIPHLESFGIFELFDPRVVSCEIGHSKSELNYTIFEIAKEKAKLDYNEILYIDDRQDHLDRAKELGYNVLLFTDAHKLEKDLIEMKLL